MRNLALLLSTIFVFGVLNYAIYDKQQILKGGDLVLLPLVPADPRSLIQGDYMRLGFAVEDDMHKTDLNTKPVNPNGLAVIVIDDKNQGKFTRFYAGEALANNEKLVKYNYRVGGFRPFQLTPNSFLFQEGQSKYYQDAKFAILRYNGHKDYLLVGLANANGEKITPPLTPLLNEKSHTDGVDR